MFLSLLQGIQWATSRRETSWDPEAVYLLIDRLQPNNPGHALSNFTTAALPWKKRKSFSKLKARTNKIYLSPFLPQTGLPNEITSPWNIYPSFSIGYWHALHTMHPKHHTNTCLGISRALRVTSKLVRLCSWPRHWLQHIWLLSPKASLHSLLKQRDCT